MTANLADYPWGYVFPALAMAGLVAIRVGPVRRGTRGVPGLLRLPSGHADQRGVRRSTRTCCLPARTRFGLTIYNAATSDYGLRVGPGLVDSRHDSGARLLRFHLSPLRGQGAAGGRGLLNPHFRFDHLLMTSRSLWTPLSMRVWMQ